MKISITNKQYNALILAEVENVALKRGSTNGENMKAIWKAIDKKQRELYQEVFGELSEKIYDITCEKQKQMNKLKPKGDFMRIPKNMFSAGNKKLPANVLIVNMSSALMCPSYFLGLCKITNGACYAMRDENQYSRVDQGSVLNNNFKRDLVHTQMLQQYQHGNKKPYKDFFRLLEMYIQLGNAYSENLYRQELEKWSYKLGGKMTNEQKRLLRVQCSENKITEIRLNESGDFHCQLAVDLWSKFAKKMKMKYQINSHAYTARNLDFSKASDNIAINYSHHGNGNERGDLPREFKAVDDETYDSLTGGDQVKNGQPILGQKQLKNGGIEYFYKCPCKGDESTCDRCGVCFNKNKTGKQYTIYVRYHGVVAANGLKNLFTTSEMKRVMSLGNKSNWYSKGELKTMRNKDTRTRLNNYSDKVLKQRSGELPQDDANKEKSKNEDE